MIITTIIGITGIEGDAKWRIVRWFQVKAQEVCTGNKVIKVIVVVVLVVVVVIIVVVLYFVIIIQIILTNYIYIFQLIITLI